MKIRLITLLALMLLLLTCVCVWKYWPNEREQTEFKTKIEIKVAQKPIPAEPYEPLSQVTQGGDNEDHSWALDVADRRILGLRLCDEVLVSHS